MVNPLLRGQGAVMPTPVAHAQLRREPGLVHLVPTFAAGVGLRRWCGLGDDSLFCDSHGEPRFEELPQQHGRKAEQVRLG
jgi:hypothetical protein